MADSLDALIRDIGKYNDKKLLLKSLRREIRKPVPKVRKAVRKNILRTLPRRGGLAKWVAASRMTVRVTLSGYTAGIRFVVGRRSSGGQSDINAIDRGRVRHPSWGRRAKGQWHTQMVTPKAVSEPVEEIGQWARAVDDAIDVALAVIRRG